MLDTTSVSNISISNNRDKLKKIAQAILGYDKIPLAMHTMLKMQMGNVQRNVNNMTEESAAELLQVMKEFITMLGNIINE